VHAEQAEHALGDTLTDGRQIQRLVDEPGDAGQLLGLPLLADDLRMQLGPAFGVRARGVQLALQVGDRLAEPRDLAVARPGRAQRSAPAKNAEPSSLNRKPTGVRVPLLKVTRSLDKAAGGDCAVAGAGCHDARTTSNARAHRAALTLQSEYRIHARRHSRPSSWLRSWKEFVEVQ
jgi:hypothetical protein